MIKDHELCQTTHNNGLGNVHTFHDSVGQASDSIALFRRRHYKDGGSLRKSKLKMYHLFLWHQECHQETERDHKVWYGAFR